MQGFKRISVCGLLILSTTLVAPVFAQKARIDRDSNEVRLWSNERNPRSHLLVKNAPKLGVTVRVPVGRPVPDQLKKYLVKDVAFDNPRLKIDATDQAAVIAALKNPDLHVEIDRPKALTPIMEIAPFNLDARISHRVPEFEAAFAGVRGKTIKIAVFDEGRILDSHQEFQDAGASRIIAKSLKAFARHSTHCAGTVCAKGVESQAIGMATQATLLSYDWDNDTVNLDQDAAGFQVSSHSYGPLSGWVPNYPMPGKWNWWGGLDDEKDSRYGKYTDDCSELDEVLSKHPHVVTFFAAGNDRGKAPQIQPTTHYVVSAAEYSTKVRPKIGGTTGLDSITGSGLAKNVICIGAIDDVPFNGGPNTIRITSFTGVGPADDGRIKPDLVANGFQLYSTSDAASDAYVEMSGTSMATPTAAGIGGLLWEVYKITHSRDAASAEIKAALIHTARDGGIAGPDPQYGWGAIDALAAGRLIKGTHGRLVENPGVNTVSAGETKSFSFAASNGPIRATLVWVDPPAPPNAGGVDDGTPVLQNDLDIKITSPSGTVYLPYSLNVANLWNLTTNSPTAARTDRANRVDNVEVVDAPSAEGIWKIEVSAFKLNVGTNQSFALAVSGLADSANP